jgi:hypothetical protein
MIFRTDIVAGPSSSPPPPLMDQGLLLRTAGRSLVLVGAEVDSLDVCHISGPYIPHQGQYRSPLHAFGERGGRHEFFGVPPADRKVNLAAACAQGGGRLRPAPGRLRPRGSCARSPAMTAPPSSTPTATTPPSSAGRAAGIRAVPARSGHGRGSVQLVHHIQDNRARCPFRNHSIGDGGSKNDCLGEYGRNVLLTHQEITPVIPCRSPPYYRPRFRGSAT